VNIILTFFILVTGITDAVLKIKRGVLYNFISNERSIHKHKNYLNDNLVNINKMFTFAAQCYLFTY